MKIVINNCFGGFSLSPKATKRLAELQGRECYFFRMSLNYVESGDLEPLTLEEAEKARICWVAYSVPNPETHRLHERDTDGLYKSANERAEKIALGYWDIERHDPLLVQVVEELGEEANGACASLKVVEIPDGTDYVIEEYDGNEHIAEAHQTWS